MARKPIQDPGGAVKISLFADEECEAKIDALHDPLAALEPLVDLAAIAEKLDQDCPRPARLAGGRPPYPTEVMVRIVKHIDTD